MARRNKLYRLTLTYRDSWGISNENAPWNNQADIAVVATSRQQVAEFLHAAGHRNVTIGYLSQYCSEGDSHPTKDTHLLDQPGVHARPDMAYDEPWTRITDGTTDLKEKA